MYAKPSAVNHDVASRNSKTEPHDLQLATSHSPQLATADGAQESAATVLLAAMNSEEIIGKIHSAFLAPDGSKLKLDVNMFVKCIVNLLLNGPGKERFAAGSAAKDTLLPLLCDIFAAVDSENRGSVTWEELSTYLLQGAMQHSSDVKLSRVFATRAMEEIALLFKRPGGTLWLNERHLLATWDKGGNVLHLIDWERMIEVTRLPNAATIVTAICISKNRLAVSLFNHTVVIWNTASFDGMSIEYMMLHSSSQVSLLWQGGLSRLLCGGSDGTITCWSCSSSPVKLFANQIHGDSVRIMTNITGMDSFATSGNDGKVLLLDQVTHKVRRSYKGHASTVHSICWEPTLKLIVTASISSEIVGYSPYSDRELFRLVKHLVAVSGL
jgi:WD40 repeat protein